MLYEVITRLIEAGLQQRARLLDMLLKDLYGEQRVLKSGIVPAEVIFAHQGFIRPAQGLLNEKQAALKIYAADMSRGPDGVITSYSIHYTKLYDMKLHIESDFPEQFRNGAEFLSKERSAIVLENVNDERGTVP